MKRPLDSFSTRTWALCGLALLLLLQVFIQTTSTATTTPAKTSQNETRVVLRSLEQRLLSARVTDQLTQDQRNAIGAFDSPESVLRDTHKALNTLPFSEDLALALTTYAVAFESDSFAREQLVALAARPDTLERHRTILNGLTTLSANAAIEDPSALWTFASEQYGSSWLVPLLQARQAKALGETEQAASLTELADTKAFELVTSYVIIGGLDMGALFLGLFSLLFLVGPLRRRALALGKISPPGPSPFSLGHAFELLAVWLIGLTLAPVVMALTLGQIPDLAQVARLLAALIPLAIVLVLLKRYPYEGPLDLSIWRSIGLRPKRFAVTVLLWGIVAYSIAYAIGGSFALLNAILFAPPELQSSLKLLSERQDIWPLILITLSAGIIAPLTEEIMFRGILYRALRDHVSPLAGLLGSSFLFALVHGQLTLMLPMMGLGLAFALIYQWSGSLWLAILAHMGWNLMTILRMELLWV